MSFDYEKANEMLTRAKAGDQQAFAYLYEAYYTYAYTGTEKLGTIEDREDATQEAFVKCFAKLQTGENITNFGTYIKHTAQNVATDMIKAREAGKRINADSNIVSNDDGEEIDIYDEIDSEEQVLYAVNEFYKNPETLYEKEEVKALLDEILGVLTTEQRESLIMQYMEGYKQTEIADVYGVSVNTVKSYVNQGKAKVKKKVTEIENRRGIKIQGSLLAFFFALLHANIEAEAASLSVSGAAFVSANMAASTPSKGILGALKAFFSKSVSVAGKTISTKAIAIATAGVVGVGAVTGVAIHNHLEVDEFGTEVSKLMESGEYDAACAYAADGIVDRIESFYDNPDYTKENAKGFTDFGAIIDENDEWQGGYPAHRYEGIYDHNSNTVRLTRNGTCTERQVYDYYLVLIYYWDYDDLNSDDVSFYVMEGPQWYLVLSEYEMKAANAEPVYTTHNKYWCYCFDTYDLGLVEFLREDTAEELDVQDVVDENTDTDYGELPEADDEEPVPEVSLAGTQWGQSDGPRFMLRFETEESGFIGNGDMSGTFTKNSDGTYNAHMGYDHLAGTPAYTDWHGDYTFVMTKNADNTFTVIWNNEVNYKRTLIREY